jgi:hypothetical protein
MSKCTDCDARVRRLWTLAADEELPYDELPPEWEQRCAKHATGPSYANIGQPCGGYECNGQEYVCKDCGAAIDEWRQSNAYPY